MSKEILLSHMDLIHTTPLGRQRIQKNLNLVIDVEEYCKSKIMDSESLVKRSGKNYYITYQQIVFTVNASNYCIITAHKKKK